MKRPTYVIAWRGESGDVELRVRHRGRRIRFALGYSCSSEQWNAEKQSFTREIENYRVKNAALVVVLGQVGQLVDQLMSSKEGYSHARFKALFRPSQSSTDVVSYAEVVVDRLKKAKQLGNASVYQGLASMLRGEMKGRPMTFEMITPAWLTKFETSLRSRDATSAGIGHYMRTLRALYNKAIVDGHATHNAYPFFSSRNPQGYNVGKLKGTSKGKALDSDVLKTLLRACAAKDAGTWPKIWSFEFHGFGINFVDVANLQWPDINGGRLRYTRQKTMRNGSGVSFNVKLTPPLEDAIRAIGTPDREYVFPILDERRHKTDTQKYHRIQKCRRQMNEAMRKLAAHLGLKINPTTYVARHSFGTELRRRGASWEDIADAYGHTTPLTTRHYVENQMGEGLDHLGDLLRTGVPAKRKRAG